MLYEHYIEGNYLRVCETKKTENLNYNFIELENVN